MPTAERKDEKSESRPTIYDVAERAGVAISTVSRVLNNSADVSDHTRRRVKEAIEALQFSPDRTAKALAQRQIPMLSIAVPTFTTPFHNELLKGVRSGLRDAEVDLLVCDLAWAAPEETLLAFLRRGVVDGLLLAGFPLSQRIARELKSLGAPVVLIGQQWDGIDSLYWDEAAGARLGIEHLIRRGHRRIGVVTTPIQTPLRDARLQGYREALAAAGLPHEEALVATGETEKHAGFSEESGYEGMQHLLTLDPPVTAVFTSSDVQAVGAWKAIRDAGYRVPEDFALLGYDDIKTSRFIGLSSVAQHMHQVGEDAAELLMRRVGRTGSATPVSRLIPSELKIRRSTAGVLR